MNTNYAVYKLEAISVFKDSRYEGFLSVSTTSLHGNEHPFLDNFMPENFESRDWKPRPLKSIWKPQQVTGNVQKFNDYPCVNSSIPAFSQRAVDALRDFLEPNGELLPLATDLGRPYWIYHSMTVSNAFDPDHSEVQWDAFSQVLAGDVDRFVFFEDRLALTPIFRIFPRPFWVFVTQPFVDRVKQHKLQGFRFLKVWPLPEGIHWKALAKEESRQHTKRHSKKRTPNANTLVIRLMYENPQKLSVAEDKKIDALMDQIDGLLYTSNPKSKAIGSLEGDDKGIDGECRLFLSCPDVDALVEKLRPWFKQLDWRTGFHVLKRYGEIEDFDAEEIYVNDL
jgi:hypothetical protein